MNCINRRCTKEPTHLVMLKLRPPSGIGALKLLTSLTVCRECKRRLTLGDVLTDGAWQKVMQECQVRGVRTMPDRAKTLLRYSSLDQPKTNQVLRPGSLVVRANAASNR